MTSFGSIIMFYRVQLERERGKALPPLLNHHPALNHHHPAAAALHHPIIPEEVSLHHHRNPGLLHPLTFVMLERL
jgi:hypothetical protein